MSHTTDSSTGDASRKSRKPLFFGLIISIIGGLSAFYVVYADPLKIAESTTNDHAPHSQALPPVSYVPLDPLVISLSSTSGPRHLRFTAQLEVTPHHLQEVELLKPRIVDVLNNYLRAIQPSDLEGPTALIRLRSHMLRRIQVVTGEGRVQNLLVMEFVLN